MAKKRRSNFATKPQSTVPSSFSTAKEVSRKEDAGPSSVNELISNLRRAEISQNDRNNISQPPTVHPSVRSLLHMPDTPAPRPRIPTRVDANGHRLPSGPAPPKSWVLPSQSAYGPAKSRSRGRIYPKDVLHLPGASMPPGLTHLCLMNLARNWEFQSNYNTYYLATMPTRLRVLLLSYIAVYGPEEGIGIYGLNNLLRPPTGANAEDDFVGNEDFRRLDLSGAIGRSVSFSKLLACLFPEKEKISSEETWDVDAASSTLYRNPTTFLPFLTHLSLSHPPPNISWLKFLEFAKNVPTITHLSLAHWPEPSLTPNSLTATVDTRNGLSVQYGGTNYYSHSLDGDWSEAASILRRLSRALYNLEWLNLDGCTEWSPALRCTTHGINWKEHWSKIRKISLKSCYDLTKFEESREGTFAAGNYSGSLLAGKDVVLHKQAVIKAVEVETHIRRARGWIVVEHDDWEKYDDRWEDDERKAYQHLWDERMREARFSRTEYPHTGSVASHDTSNFWV